MEKKDQGLKTIAAVYAIVTALYLVVFFVIPFPKIEASWIAFAFTLVSFGVGFGIVSSTWKKSDTMISKFYGFPVFRIGYMYPAAQLILCFIICVVAAIFALPYWVSLVLSVLLLGVMMLGLIVLENVRQTIDTIERETVERTRQMKLLEIKALSMAEKCADAVMKKEIEKLAEDFRFSDPMSSEETAALEEKIMQGLDFLQTNASEMTEEEMTAQVRNIKLMLAERNRICKAFK